MKSSLDFTGQRPGLFDLPPIPVTVLSGKELGEGGGKSGLARAADALLRQLQHGNGLLNEDTGWLLRINKDGRKKMGDNADLSISETQAVAGIESLARHAVVSERHPDFEHRNPDVASVLRLYAPVIIDGKPYRVKLTVKDYKGRDAKKELHALAAVEIENAPLGTFPSYSGDESLQTGQPTTGREISIVDLLFDATLFDGTLFIRPSP
jgi:hypothetical protein